MKTAKKKSITLTAATALVLSLFVAKADTGANTSDKVKATATKSTGEKKVKSQAKPQNDYFVYDFGFWWTDPNCKSSRKKKASKIITLTKK